jgi:formylglycine-generating enzyme
MIATGERRRIRSRDVLGSLVIVAAWGFFATACEEKTKVEPEGASAGGGAAEGGSGGGGGHPPDKLACATGLPGAALVRVQTSDGTVYCMDQREVSWGEYKAFLAVKSGDTSGQPSECSWNATYEPQYCDPLDDTCMGVKYDRCPAESQPTSDRAAADCLDFCDALAYCRWAGKRLCGRVGGEAKWGLVDVADVSTTAEKESLSKLAGTTAMELIHACTQGGTTAYPYGNVYDAARCTDDLLDIADLSSKTCHGSVPPFNQIYDVTASVEEWQNLCTMSPELSCLSGGGGKAADEKAQMCSAQVGFAYSRAVAPRQGFRCCADGVPISNARP